MSFQKNKNCIYMILDADVYLVGEIENNSINWMHWGESFLTDEQRDHINATMIN